MYNVQKLLTLSSGQIQKLVHIGPIANEGVVKGDAPDNISEGEIFSFYK